MVSCWFIINVIQTKMVLYIKQQQLAILYNNLKKKWKAIAINEWIRYDKLNLTLEMYSLKPP